jgi:predicted HicB family RNase H-like nuclease
MVKRTKTGQLNIYIAEELKDAAMRAAAADQRSLTSLIEKLLTAYCQEHGFLPSDRTKARKAR